MASARAAGLRPSPTLWLRRLLEELSRRGLDYYSLHVGQPGVPPPRELVEALARRLLEGAGSLGLYSYTHPRGLPEAREAVAEDAASLGRPRAEAGVEVTLTTGALEGLTALLMALADPGEPVGFLVPAYFHFYTAARLAGLRVVEAPVYPSLEPGEGAWRRLFQSSRVVVAANPDNPTGRTLTWREARLLADLACDHRVYLIHDVAYATLYYEGERVWPERYCPDYVVTLGSYSKDPGVPGWRVGYIIAPGEVVEAVDHVREALSYNPPLPSQLLVVEYVRGRYRDRHLPRLLEEYRRRRDALAEALREHLPQARYKKPQAGMFIYTSLEGLLPTDSWTAAHRLAREARVVTVPGTLFGPGGEGWLRLSFTGEPPHRLEEAVKAIAEWLKANKGQPRP